MMRRLRARCWAPAVAAALVLAGAATIAAAPGRSSAKAGSEVLARLALRNLPRYPGARRAIGGGFPIAGAPSTPSSPKLLSAHARWLGPVGGSRFAVWLAQTFAVQGLNPDPSASSGGPRGAVANDLSFTPYPDRDQLTVGVSWQVRPNKPTAVRYDVQAIWQPPRPPDAVLPPGLTAAVVTLVDATHPKGRTQTVRGGGVLAALAAVASALPVDTRGAHGYPAETTMAVTSSSVVGPSVWPHGSLAFEEGAASCASTLVGGGRARAAPRYNPTIKLLRTVATHFAR